MDRKIQKYQKDRWDPDTLQKKPKLLLFTSYSMYKLMGLIVHSKTGEESAREVLRPGTTEKGRHPSRTEPRDAESPGDRAGAETKEAGPSET